MRTFEAFERKNLFPGVDGAWKLFTEQNGCKVSHWCRPLHGQWWEWRDNLTTWGHGVKATAKSTCPPVLQFYNPTRSHNSDNGISKFANLKSCFISSVSCSRQCFMEGCGDFSPEVSPARLWLYADLCSSVEDGEKLECNTEELLPHYSENWKVKIPFLIIYSAKGKRDQVPRVMATMWHKSRTWCLLRQDILLQFPGEVICVQPRALLRDKIWPDLSLLKSSSLCIP